MVLKTDNFRTKFAARGAAQEQKLLLERVERLHSVSIQPEPRYLTSSLYPGEQLATQQVKNSFDVFEQTGTRCLEHRATFH